METNDIVVQLQHTENIVKSIMQSKHYAKMGAEGVYAIVQKARSLGIDPIEALNGGIFYVQGKTEMSSQMMNRLIRMKGHSIQKDEKSTKTNCILHGRRSDNQDKWTVAFSIDDAKKAGLVKAGGPWEKYTEVMCFNRALSMLARQLFPDVIVDCYVQGEISDAPPLHSAPVVVCTAEEALELADMISDCDKPNEVESGIFSKVGIRSLNDIPADRYAGIKKWVQSKINEKPRVVEVTAETMSAAKDGEIAMEMSIFDDREAP